MRDEMAGDVAAERQLNVIERLLALMPRTWPRSRGFWVSADGNVSVYPASPRARLPAEKSVKAIPSRPSVNRARSPGGGRGRPVPHPSGPGVLCAPPALHLRHLAGELLQAKFRLLTRFGVLRRACSAAAGACVLSTLAPRLGSERGSRLGGLG